MNKLNLILSVSAAVLLTSVMPAAAQSTWQTVDDYQAAPGKAAGNRCIAIAPNGSIFLSGVGQDGNGISCALVHRSRDGGASWEVVFQVPAANFMAITVAPSGSVVVAGPTVKKWITYRSADNGATWTLVDSVPSPASATPWAASTDSLGRIYVCGQVSEGNGFSHWQVRRSADDGSTWAIVDDFRAPGSTVAKCIAFTSSSIVVAGSIGGVWTVRRSGNDGATWTVAEQFQLNSRYTSYASGAAAGPNGTIYVTGYSSTRTEGHWVTRRSTNGGMTWETSDDVTANRTGVGKNVRADAFGRIFAVGTLGDPARWVTRGSIDGGATWFTSDSFALSSGAATAWSVAGDASGNVFVVGDSLGGDGVNHAIVRKVATP